MRTLQRDVECIVTATQDIHLGPGQTFWRTAKAWEIWEKGTLFPDAYRVKRIPCTRVFWVIPKDEEETKA